MEKEILVLLKISNNKLLITAIEKFNFSNIEIYSNKTIPVDLTASIEFVKNSVEEIENLILAKIEEVSIIYDATNFAKIKQKLIKKSISNLNNKEIKQEHLVETLKKVNDFYEEIEPQSIDVPILHQAFQFNIIDENNNVKTFTEFPIGKKANKIESFFSVTTIAKDHYNSALNICKAAGLKITRIYSSSNITPYIFENNDKKAVSITLQVEKNYSNLIITNNGVTVVTKNLKYNFEDLCKKIATEFKISKKLVYELISNEGIITKDFEKLNKVIFNKKNEHIKAQQLTSILKSFVKTLIEESRQFIEEKHKALKDHPLNLIGRIEVIEKLEEYCKIILPNNKININSRPINYLLLNYSNRTIFGLSNLIDNINKFNSKSNKIKNNTANQRTWIKPLYKKNILISASK